ncbi:MAG: SMC family ATPase [Vagococcus sp.]|uniref:SMC family ATPase n=2 Tax=Vagococcus sp. TaxID=1933889 RepID=UPI002FCABD8D
MQPIRLKLENFGPYKNSLIDFSDFYAQSLFLITGKTGAGKTTIFDGMTFALYGSTSGGLRQGREMRSNFAEVGDKTRVTFTFKQGNKTYEVLREPEQLVKKLRGEGFREQPALVRLTVFDENQKEIEQLTKQKDVGIFLSELIQLNESQFSQIVMLPQGEFRRFLNADSDSKEKVLRKLFNTYFYQDIAEFLRQKKKMQEVSLKDLRQELALLITQLEWQKEFSENHEENMYYQDLLESYKKQEIQYLEEEKKHLLDLKKLEEELVKQNEVIQKESKWLDSFKEREDAYQKVAQLNTQKIIILEEKKQVATLKKIEKIRGNYNQLVELEDEYQNLLKEEKKLTEKEENCRSEMLATQTKLKKRLESQSEIEDNQKLLTKIDISLPLFEKKKQLEEKRKELNTQLFVTKEKEEELTKQLKKLTSDKEQIEGSILQKTKLVEKKFELVKKQDEVAQQLVNIELFEKNKECLRLLEEEIKELAKELIACKNQEIASQKMHKMAKSDWAKAQIAKLSLDLIDGESCPVCGSLDHPAPVHGKDVTKEDMLILEKSLEKIEKELSENKEIQTKTTQKIEFKDTEKEKQEVVLVTLRKQIQDSFEEKSLLEEKWLEKCKETKDDLLNELKQVTMTLEELEKEEEGLPKLKQTILESQTLLEQEKNQVRELENQLLELKVTYQELQDRLPDTWQTYQEMLVEKKQLTKKISTWNMEVDELKKQVTDLEAQLLIIETTLKNEKKQLELLNQKQEKETVILTEFLEKEQLTKETLAELIPNLATLDEQEKRIQAFENKEYALNEEVKKLDTLLIDKEKPKIEPLIERRSDLQEQEKEQQKVVTSLQYIISQNKKIVKSVKEKEDAMKDKLQALEELTELANVMTGDGPNKLSMERFVLQTYLKRILQRANEKLVLLTNGRYRFELKKEQGSFKKKTGLEINIFDDNVGALRGVNTLSGGESFIAALSLALSLAEVIQEEAGGIKIDAMFIDEGFGSLDEDALEMAIRALEAIEGDGRLIGIISHVRELKERIPQQLQINTTLDGKSYVNERLEFE